MKERRMEPQLHCWVWRYKQPIFTLMPQIICLRLHEPGIMEDPQNAQNTIQATRETKILPIYPRISDASRYSLHQKFAGPIRRRLYQHARPGTPKIISTRKILLYTPSFPFLIAKRSTSAVEGILVLYSLTTSLGLVFCDSVYSLKCDGTQNLDICTAYTERKGLKGR